MQATLLSVGGRTYRVQHNFDQPQPQQQPQRGQAREDLYTVGVFTLLAHFNTHTHLRASIHLCKQETTAHDDDDGQPQESVSFSADQVLFPALIGRGGAARKALEEASGAQASDVLQLRTSSRHMITLHVFCCLHWSRFTKMPTSYCECRSTQIIFPRQPNADSEIKIKGSQAAVQKATLRLQIAIDSLLQVRRVLDPRSRSHSLSHTYTHSHSHSHTHTHTHKNTQSRQFDYNFFISIPLATPSSIQLCRGLQSTILAESSLDPKACMPPEVGTCFSNLCTHICGSVCVWACTCLSSFCTQEAQTACLSILSPCSISI